MSVKLKQVFSGKRLDEVHALYETAFPASEKKPFSMIVSGQGTGLVEILSLEENNRFLGLAIMAKAGDRVLLDYFAIADTLFTRSARVTRCPSAHVTIYLPLPEVFSPVYSSPLSNIRRNRRFPPSVRNILSNTLFWVSGVDPSSKRLTRKSASTRIW